MSICFRLLRVALLLAGAMVLAQVAWAQHGGGHGGGMPGGEMSGPRGPSGFRDHGGFPRGGPAGDASGASSTMRSGFQLGPPGRWWDDKHFAKTLKLRPDQQHRMDGIFETNRGNLLRRYQDLEVEQNKMETLVHSKILDEAALFSQIDHVAQARADLEKANTHLLLQIRNEMDADQLAFLEQHH